MRNPRPNTPNPNHPKMGSTIRVEPIKDLKDIKAIKRLLKDNPRDLCLFTLGINTNLRASDLLSLTVGQVRSLKPGDELVLKERKTGKHRRITLNRAVVTSIDALLNARLNASVNASVNAKLNLSGDQSPLFTGQRGPLTVPTINRMVKGWCKAINLKGNYGSHSLRKTFGYHQRVSFGVGLPELMVVFNHSSQRQTLDYLCVQPEEVRSLYQNEL